MSLYVLYVGKPIAVPMQQAALILHAGVIRPCSPKGYLTPFRQNNAGSLVYAKHVWIRIKRRQSKIKSLTVNPVRLFLCRYYVVL
jgi:hypothetical protein